jgi:uncharacterized protein (DUF4415 family)
VRRRIGFSDIPEASYEQLGAMRRVARPRLGDAARQLIAIRVDPDVLKRFRKQAKRRKIGDPTLINQVLAEQVGSATCRSRPGRRPPTGMRAGEGDGIAGSSWSRSSTGVDVVLGR